MRVQVTDTPRLFSTRRNPRWITLRVITGAVKLGTEQIELLSGYGLPIATTDNIVSVVWPEDQLWIQSSPPGTVADVELVL
jgi:hypothetical protein